MSVFKRMSQVFQQKANAALNKVEDPTQALDLSYQKMLENLQQVRRSIADVLTSQKRLEAQQATLQAQYDKLQGQARQALQQGQEEELDAKMLLKILVMAGFPMLLVIKQPDIGTALVMGSVLLTMLVLAKVPLKWLAVLFLLGAIGIVAILSLGILQKYQLQRLTSFVNPKTSTLQAGYNLAQSKIAIGSGGLFGKGIFHGTQTNLSYVPEQQTDFIFTAVGEQLGFVGAGGLLLAYAYMVWRVWCIMKRARDPLGRMLAGGVLGLLAFSIFQNAGMTMGIMPITGIPLPFMSYGGSAALAFFAAIGLVLNVGMRNPK